MAPPTTSKTATAASSTPDSSRREKKKKTNKSPGTTVLPAAIEEAVIDTAAERLSRNERIDEILRRHHESIASGDSPQRIANSINIAEQLFELLQAEARALLSSPLTAIMARSFVLEHDDLPSALASFLAGKVCHGAFATANTEAAATQRGFWDHAM